MVRALRSEVTESQESSKAIKIRAINAMVVSQFYCMGMRLGPCTEDTEVGFRQLR